MARNSWTAINLWALSTILPTFLFEMEKIFFSKRENRKYFKNTKCTSYFLYNNKHEITWSKLQRCAWHIRHRSMIHKREQTSTEHLIGQLSISGAASFSYEDPTMINPIPLTSNPAWIGTGPNLTLIQTLVTVEFHQNKYAMYSP